LSRVLRHPVLLSIGTYSYTIYIVHYHVGEWIKVHVLARYAVAHPGVTTVLEIGGTVALSWAIAWVSWRVLERPLLSLKRFVPMPRPRDVGATTIGVQTVLTSG
jgi:peptidoglycan/LPS O-acetylase OafA/YrhL